MDENLKFIKCRQVGYNISQALHVTNELHKKMFKSKKETSMNLSNTKKG